MASLSSPALKVINDYLNLPFQNGPVSCPYYNNRRLEIHGGLRAAIGKGNVEDIMEEAMIISLRDRIDLKNLKPDEFKKFLTDHRLGIDCSGLAYYVLDAELKSKGKSALKNNLNYCSKNPLRWLLTKLRPTENTNVKTFADKRNSKEVKLKDIQPGDLIILTNTGQDHGLQHVLIVHEVASESSPGPSAVAEGGREPSPSQRRGQGEVSPVTVHYTHSFAWRTDGRYNTGVKQGTILVQNPAGTLLEQTWTESEKTGPENETFEHAKMAEKVEIRQLLAF